MDIYQVQLKEALDDRWTSRFEGFALSQREDGTTLLRGPVPDQAALHGLLMKVRDLGLTLLAVFRVEPDEAEIPLNCSVGGEEMNKVHKRPFWHTASELPEDVFAAWRKPERAISPVAIVATTDPDGTPRTAPFGSLRALTPRLLQLCSHHSHDTYVNLCRDERVSVALVSPDVAASVRGRARVVRERMEHDENGGYPGDQARLLERDQVRQHDERKDADPDADPGTEQGDLPTTVQGGAGTPCERRGANVGDEPRPEVLEQGHKPDE